MCQNKTVITKLRDTNLSSNNWCTFCDKFGHTFRDSLLRLTCPNLRKRVCPLCYETGDNAHTIKHCPIRIRLIKQQQIAQFALKTQPF